MRNIVEVKLKFPDNKPLTSNIVVFSDSHYNDKALEQAVLHASKLDNIIAAIHLGDCVEDVGIIKKVRPNWQTFNIRGNNDYFSKDTPEQIVIKAGDLRILATHGHKFSSYDMAEDLIEYAKKTDVSIVCFGHTHMPYCQSIDGITLLNPGSCAYPRGGSSRGYASISLLEDSYFCDLHEF